MKREIDAFLNHLKTEKGFSDNTVEAYENDLYQLVDFLEGEARRRGDAPPQWDKADQQLFLKYILDLKQRGYAPTTVARKLSAMKSLFKFLASKGVVDSVPAAVVEPSQVKRPSPQSISVEDVKELLKQPEKSCTPESGRDKAMLELLYNTGMRVSEVISLDLDDVDLAGKCVVCRGSNARERRIILSETVAHHMRHYVSEVRPQLMRGRKERALFLNRLGQRLTRQGFWQILKNYAKAADLGEKVTPRTLRHSAAFHMLHQGNDLRTVQKQLGHASISTTQIYAQHESDKPYAKAS